MEIMDVEGANFDLGWMAVWKEEVLPADLKVPFGADQLYPRPRYW